MNNKHYYIVQDITGKLIDSYLTLELAEDAIEQLEEDDAEQCTYVPGYYNVTTLASINKDELT